MEWIKIEDYDYSVNRNGEVRNDKSERIMKCGIDKGYYNVGLSKNGKQTRYLLHRLIAKSFLPNPNNYLFIDHKNCVRSDNTIENLR